MHAERTAENLENQFKRSSGAYLSSINAGKDDQEGGLYTWTYEELNDIDKENMLASFFNVSRSGNWQNGNKRYTHSPKEYYLNYFKSDEYKLLQQQRLKEKRFQVMTSLWLHGIA